jgi:multidrug efflux pump subunit AcrA (membrane-fusion protein)
MRYSITAIAALVIVGMTFLPAASQPRTVPPPPSGVEAVRSCLVTLIDEAEVSAQEQGVLMDLKAREGDSVVKDTPLAQIDDAQVVAAENVAKYELEAAEAEAGNDVNVRFAQAATDVAYAEYQQALDANRKVPNTHPQAELRRLLLEHRKYTLQIEQSEHELGIAKVSVKAKKAHLEAAHTDVERRKIKAPIDGIVVKRYRHLGEWVRPGDPVYRVVRADRLRIEGFLDANKVSPAQVNGQAVVITVGLPHGRQESFEGKIVFVSPLVEAGAQFLVHAEVVNRQENGFWLLRPGLTADMNIQLKR